MNLIITRSSNNYGPNQNSEKLLPVIINSLRNKRKIPVYGNGLNRRDWIHVYDNCAAIELVLEKGIVGEIYNIAGNNELSNLDLINAVINIMGGSSASVQFIEDRKGHDFRYGIDSTKIKSSLGFEPITQLRIGLQDTVNWYLKN